MNSLASLAIKSLLNRKSTSILTVITLALSVALLLTVETVRRSAEQGFTSSISQTDLIVGGRTGPVNLLLFSIFNIGNASNNVSWESYLNFKSHPSIEWTIPISLGDSHRGFRVVGTTPDMLKYYRYRGDQSLQLRSGRWFEGLWDVVIGSEVASKLNYQEGASVVIAHGVTKGKAILHHDDKPFRVVGILAKTGTPIDQSLYLSLEGIEAIHIDWQQGAMPSPEAQVKPDEIQMHELKPKSITAFLLGSKNRIQTLKLQREINEFTEEALTAIIPGVVLAEVWRTLGSVETALRFISWSVVFIGLVSMLIALLTSLQERRREMSVFRALGAPFTSISFLIVFECTILSIVGAFGGLFIKVLTLGLSRNWIETQFGFYFNAPIITGYDMILILVVVVIGFLAGWVPAYKSARLALKDGLIPKV